MTLRYETQAYNTDRMYNQPRSTRTTLGRLLHVPAKGDSLDAAGRHVDGLSPSEGAEARVDELQAAAVGAELARQAAQAAGVANGYDVTPGATEGKAMVVCGVASISLPGMHATARRLTGTHNPKTGRPLRRAPGASTAQPLEGQQAGHK